MSNWHFPPTGANASFEGGIWLQFIDGWQDWPGVMAGRDADEEWRPSREAEMFSRELIQNFWDAAVDQRDEFQKTGEGNEQPSIEFVFRSLTGERKQAVVDALHLDDLNERYLGIQETDQASTFRIARSEFLTTNGHSDLEVLVVRERASSGMYGVWDKKGQADISAKMFFALVQSQGTDKGFDTGGSFGKGKGAIALASRMRVLAAYTAFNRPTGRLGEDVSRRFLGVTYWTKHAIENAETMGLGILGDPNGAASGSIPSPWADGDADDLVRALGIESFEVRDPDEPSDLGTTYLILEPSFTPSDLALAIQRNWWPALVAGNTFGLRVENYDGESVPIAPRSDNQLKPFVRAFELVLGQRPPNDDTELTKSIETAETKVGTLGLTSDMSENGFTFTDAPGPNNIVALVRNDMVIQYRRFGMRDKPPFVRGTLVVDRDRNVDAAQHLARIEPVLHNNWPTQREQGVEEEGRRLAAGTIRNVGTAVGGLIRKLMPQPSKEPEHLSVFDQLFSGLTEQTASRPRRPTKERKSDAWSIHYLGRDVEADHTGTNRHAFTEVAITLKEDLEVDEMPVKVSFAWEVDEDGVTPRIEPSLHGEISLVGPVAERFRRVDVGVFEGILTHDEARFSLFSGPYGEDWTVHPSVRVASMVEAPEGERPTGD